MFLSVSADYYSKYITNDYKSLIEEYEYAVKEKIPVRDSLVFYTAELSTDIVKSITLYTHITNKFTKSPFYLTSLFRLSKYYFMVNDTIKGHDNVKKLIYSDDHMYSPLGYMIIIGYYEKMGVFEKTKKLVNEMNEKYPDYWFIANYGLNEKEHVINVEKYYTVQVGAFSAKDNAEKLKKEFISNGYKDTHIVQRNELFKVMIGKFDTYEKAMSYSTVLQKSEGISVWVIKVE